MSISGLTTTSPPYVGPPAPDHFGGCWKHISVHQEWKFRTDRHWYDERAVTPFYLPRPRVYEWRAEQGCIQTWDVAVQF